MEKDNKRTPEELRAIVADGGANLITSVLGSGNLELLAWAVDVHNKAHKVAEKVIAEQTKTADNS